MLRPVGPARIPGLSSHTLCPAVPTRAGTSQQVYVCMMLRPLAAAIDAALGRYQQEQQTRQRQQAAKAPP